MNKINQIPFQKLGLRRIGSTSFIKKKEGLKTVNSSVDQVLHLQRTAGNQAVQRLFKSGAIQAKLKIGKPNDRYEQEADRVANIIMKMQEPICPACREKEGVRRQPEEEEADQPKQPIAEQITPLIQRQEESELEKEGEEEPVQIKANLAKTPTVTPGLNIKIKFLRGGGQPLPQSIRNYFEPRFGTDFSQVRIHTDSKASETAKSIKAKAFTKGRDIVFGAGQYSSETLRGRSLLAHELTHVVQQDKNPLLKSRDQLVQKAKAPSPVPQQSRSKPFKCKWHRDPQSFAKAVAEHYLSTEYNIKINASRVDKKMWRLYNVYFRKKGLWKYVVNVDWRWVTLPPNPPEVSAKRIIPPPHGLICVYNYSCTKKGDLKLSKKMCY